MPVPSLFEIILLYMIRNDSKNIPPHLTWHIQRVYPKKRVLFEQNQLAYGHCLCVFCPRGCMTPSQLIMYSSEMLPIHALTKRQYKAHVSKCKGKRCYFEYTCLLNIQLREKSKAFFGTLPINLNLNPVIS